MIKRLARGFTLIELMIVVAIIGILAAIAVPNFVKFQCRSKQSEAKTNLKALFVAEEGYRAEYDAYQTCSTATCAQGATNTIGFQPKGQKIRYSYAAASGSATTFTATALATSADLTTPLADTWTIDETNKTTVRSNNCL
jgi:type IV pilus assembly protein PilA